MSLWKNRTPSSSSSFTSNVIMAPAHTLTGRDTVRLPDETKSLTDTLDVSETFKVTSDYIYYRIFAEDGAIPSKTHADPSNPFLGRIKVRSVPPPHNDTAQGIKRSIAKVENIKDRRTSTLFFTPYSQSHMGDADKINRTGPGSSPQEPLAFVARLSDSERSALEWSGAAEPGSASLEIRYLYYLLYLDGYEMPSKVAVDPEEPSLGRIRADFVTPPHSPAAIKRCISKVESNPALSHADLYADISCNTPLKEGHISILGTDCPGLSPKKPMAVVQEDSSESIQDGRYVIKNRAADIYWNALSNPIETVHFRRTTKSIMENHKLSRYSHIMEWDITHDTNGNISISSLYAPSMWVGAELTGSTVPVPWRLIRVDSKFYYLTTDMNHLSQNPRVPAAQPRIDNVIAFGSMATLREGDQWQMWEFIHI